MAISAVYANGNQATAIANIKAQVALCITTLADGSRFFDAPKIQQWLTDQGNQLVASSPPEYANQAAAIAQLQLTSTLQDSNTLASVVNASNWNQHPAWPPVVSVGSASFAAAFLSATAQLTSASTAVGAAFASIDKALYNAIGDFYTASGIDAVVPAGVIRILDDRFYIMTYVTDRGEESAPSPPSVRARPDQNDTILVNQVPPPPGRYINRWRIYRTNTGAQTSAFQLVVELPITTLTYTDSKKGSELGEACPTLTWLEPPANLRGMVALPNGVLAGYFGNTICFSESFVPYAWPVEYQLSTVYPVTGLAVFNQTLVVGTQGGIDYISGTDGASMSQQHNVGLQACVAPASMIQVDGGVAYASPNGLCLANSQGVTLLTKDLATRDQWQALQPASLIFAYHENTVYMFHASLPDTYALHLETGKLTMVTGTTTAVYLDRMTDRLYIAAGNQIRALFGGSEFRVATWRSKIFVTGRPESFAWLQIESDFTAPITVRWIADGVLRYTVVVTDRRPVRLPAGRFLEHEVEVLSQARWSSLMLASTTEELKSA